MEEKKYDKKEISKRKSHLRNYEFIEEMEPGEYGQKYKGFYTKTAEIVAITVIDLEDVNEILIQEIKAEIQFLTQCQDPRITKFYESFIHNTKLFIIMEFTGDKNISNIVRCTGPIPEVFLSIIGREILEVLHYVAGLGKEHSNINCSNIFLTNQGQVKLGGIGFSRTILNTISKKKNWNSSLWTAPEVVNGVAYSHKSDIWSLAIAIFEMATGGMPFPNLKPSEIITKLQSGTQPVLEGPFTRDFKDFIHQALSIAPKERPTAEELLSHEFITGAKKKSFLIDLIDSIHFSRHVKHASGFSTNSEDSDVNTVISLNDLRKQYGGLKDIGGEEEGFPTMRDAGDAIVLPHSPTNKREPVQDPKHISEAVKKALSEIRRELALEKEPEVLERINGGLQGIEAACNLLNKESGVMSEIIKDILGVYSRISPST